METPDEIKEALTNIQHETDFQKILAEYTRLLGIIGNVEDDGIVALVCLACDNYYSYKETNK